MSLSMSMMATWKDLLANFNIWTIVGIKLLPEPPSSLCSCCGSLIHLLSTGPACRWKHTTQVPSSAHFLPASMSLQHFRGHHYCTSLTSSDERDSSGDTLFPAQSHAKIPVWNSCFTTVERLHPCHRPSYSLTMLRETSSAHPKNDCSGQLRNRELFPGAHGYITDNTKVHGSAQMVVAHCRHTVGLDCSGSHLLHCTNEDPRTHTHYSSAAWEGCRASNLRGQSHVNSYGRSTPAATWVTRVSHICSHSKISVSLH